MTPAQNTDTRVNRTKLRARTDEDLLVEGIVLRACLAPLPGGLWGTPVGETGTHGYLPEIFTCHYSIVDYYILIRSSRVDTVKVSC